MYSTRYDLTGTRNMCSVSQAVPEPACSRDARACSQSDVRKEVDRPRRVYSKRCEEQSRESNEEW